MRIRLSFWIGIVLVASPAVAHDIWLAPRDFSPAAGATATVLQLVGHDFGVELVFPVRKIIVQSMALFTVNGERDLLPDAEDEEHARIPMPGQPGTALLVIEHSPQLARLKPETFARYLGEEQFPNEAELREYPPRVQVDRYSRCLKAILCVGDQPSGDAAGTIVGRGLELVLEMDPFRLDLGDGLPVQLLLDGEPLTQHPLWALRGVEQVLKDKSLVVTDETGRATVRLAGPGTWVLRAVHLAPSEADGIDWDSQWASFTFTMD